MIPTITAFRDSPDKGEGMARDTRVRWALEEVGQPYDVRLLTFAELKQPAYLAQQPFGSIPSYRDGDLTLFESGAIVLHLARRHPGLLPADPDAGERAIAWLFAALNTVEPPIVELEAFTLMEADKPWYRDRLPILQDRIRDRLKFLSARLGETEWLDGDFSVGDLMMAEVLKRLDGTGILQEFSNLAAYLARAQARPAFKRAFAAQLAVFEASQAGQPNTA